jgi:hypothetical protein
MHGTKEKRLENFFWEISKGKPVDRSMFGWER